MSKRILVIDDDEDILKIMNLIFSEEGYEVILYNTGTTAEHIKVLHPDLVLIDVRIVGYEKTGDKICAELKALLTDVQIPVILVSAEKDITELAHRCGADGYISKPFDIGAILDKVSELLN